MKALRSVMLCVARVKGWPMLLSPEELVEARQAELLGIYRDELEAVRALDEALERDRARRLAN